jgi:hypothetical protein
MMEKFAALLEMAEAFELISTAKEKAYGPYNSSKPGRKIMILIDEHGNRRTMTYPRYQLLQQTGKPVDENLTVDHRNGDRTDDRIENYQLLPRSDHSKLDTRRAKLVKLTCPMCQKEHFRTPRKIREKSKAGKRADFCSRKCAGKYSREVQLGKRKKLPPLAPPKSVYYKNKDLKSTANYLLAKYAAELVDIVADE